MLSMDKFFIKNFKKPFFALVFSLFIALVFMLIRPYNPIRELEYKTMDFRFRTFPFPEKPDSSIVLIAIDDYSLQEFSQNGISWPWPRDIYQILLQYLQQDSAKTVLFDMLFYEPDLERAETSQAYTDQLFADAIKQSGNVILAAELTHNETQAAESIKKFQVKPSHKESIESFAGAIMPIPLLSEASQSVGIINVKPDSDGIIRRVPYYYDYANYYLAQMGLAAVLQEKELNSLKLQESNEHFVFWYGTEESPFRYIPFYAIIQSFLAGESEESLLEEGFFEDKTVVIGSTASGTIRDVISTPYPQVLPGMELWATIISNLQQNHTITFVANGWIFLLLFFLIVPSYFLFCRFHRFRAQLLFFVVPLIYYLIVIISWQNFHLWLPVVSPLFAFLLTFGFLIIMSYFSEGKAKIEIQKIFSRYLHPDVISELIQHPDSVKLGGKEIRATILFSDIANFTTFSEGRKAPELIQVLNQYFNYLTNFVLQFKGLLDKYTGDGIMAIFGAPLSLEDNALLACKAALAHKRFARELSSEETTAFLHQHTRIGINTGMIVAGNLGSALRMDYTAIGDDVNLAARLEGVNKIYKTAIMISESTYKAVQEKMLCRELDTITVKGKHNATTVYELLEENTAEMKEKYSWLDEFNEAISHYKKGKWQEALQIFKIVQKKIPKDYATERFIKKCKTLLTEPPENWSYIENLESK